MEFAADSWALRLCFRHARRAGATSRDSFTTKFAMLGPHLVLSTIAIISDLQTATHPSVDRRFARIQDAIETDLEADLGKREFRNTLQGLGEDWPFRVRSIGQKLYQQHLDLANFISELRATMRSTAASASIEKKISNLRSLLALAPGKDSGQAGSKH